jgi:hypothetical protein
MKLIAFFSLANDTAQLRLVRARPRTFQGFSHGEQDVTTPFRINRQISNLYMQGAH